MSTSTSESITKVTCIAAIGLGVFGAIAPRAFARSYRFDDTNATLLHLTRLLSTRNATLGALACSPTARRSAAPSSPLDSP
jgi:hypothetical protein